MRLGLYRLHSGDSFFFEPTKQFYRLLSQGSTSALNEGMILLSSHIEAMTAPLIEDWKGPENPLTTSDHFTETDTNAPGMIHYDGPLRSRIQINITNKHTPLVLGAILAHELTHHFLFNKGVWYPDEEENERLTDFATVFLGLGKLSTNGVEPIQWTIERPVKQDPFMSAPRSYRRTTVTYKVGYLSADEMALAMRSICTFRSIPAKVAKVNLTWKARMALNRIDNRYGLFWRLACHVVSLGRHRQPQRVSSKPERHRHSMVVVECRKCHQKLRIPQTADTLRVTCPSCKTVWHT